MKADTGKRDTSLGHLKMRILLLQLLGATVQGITDCPEPKRFPGLALFEDEDSDDTVIVETDDTDELIFIKRTNDCYYSVYDREQNTVTVTSNLDSYQSYYSFQT